MTAIDTAARLLLDARRNRDRIADLPASCRPSSADQAYAVQQRVMAELGPIGAWKVGAKSPAADPTYAPIPAAVTAAGPARFAFRQFGVCILEVEIAFFLGRGLPRRDLPYSRAEVSAAVAGAMTAIEIVDSRFAEYPNIDRLSALADNQNNGALAHGRPVAEWQRHDLAGATARLMVDGRRVSETRGGNPVGDPLTVLIWLANRKGLAAGDIVTTGSCTGMVPCAGPATVVGEIEGLGPLQVTLS